MTTQPQRTVDLTIDGGALSVLLGSDGDRLTVHVFGNDVLLAATEVGPGNRVSVGLPEPPEGTARFHLVRSGDATLLVDHAAPDGEGVVPLAVPAVVDDDE